jgi:hypothetical protein
MKALISAFALLSFVAATTVPYVAHAQTNQTETTKPAPKKVKKKHKTASKKSHKKVAKKKTKAPPKPAQG